MVAELREILQRDDWRAPGCTDRCQRVRGILIGQFGTSWIEQHDVPGHEQYGISVGALQGAATEDVLTGPLAVRLLHAEALVDGTPIRLTPTEYRILAYLALRAGRLVSHEAILAEVWGPEYAPAAGRAWRRGGHDERHLVRVNMARLRGKLGPAKRLIETRTGLGFVLRAEPYTGPALDGAS